MRYGSVCSGIEAATSAWHPLGWRASFVSEIEAFPRAVLQHRWPEIPLHGDFTTIGAGEYEPIDLLVGGTPCQSFSVAGLRGGLADDRGNLALEYLRLADRLRPRWLVWENVPGVLSSNDGRDFGAILGGLVELGYGFAYRVLDAQFFGVAQRRRRVFVVGHVGDWRRAAAVLFERHSLQGHPAPRREAGEGATPCLANGAHGSNGAGVGLPGDPSFTLDIATRAAVSFNWQASGKQTTLGFNDGGVTGSLHVGQLPAVAYAIQERAVCENPDAGLDGAGYRDDGAAYTIEARSVPQAVAFALRGREGGSVPEIGGDQVSSLRAANGGSSRDYIAITPLDMRQASRGERMTNNRAAGSSGGAPGTGIGEPGDPSPTVAASHVPAIAGSAVRRLTPRECERLQGFPDDYTLIPWRKGMAPDGPRYKALGNSMAVPVMAWIGQRIEAVETTLQAAA